MCACVLVLWLTLGVVLAQDAFYHNYAYTKVMAECLGDRVYQEYLQKVSTARTECVRFASAPTSHSRGTPTPTLHSRGTPHGRGTPTSLLAPLSFASTHKDQRQGGIRSQQQGALFQQPGIFPQQPGIFSQQQGVHSQQQGVHSPQQRIYSQQTGIHSQQPGIHSQQPGIHSQQAGVLFHHPGIFSQQPGDFSPQAGLSTQQPVAFSKQPDFSFRQPKVFSQQPESFSHEPRLFSDTRGLENIGATLEVQEHTPFYPGYRQKRALVVGESEIHRAMLKVEALLGNFTCVLHRLGVVDEEMELDLEGLASNTLSLPVPAALRSDLISAIRYCRDLTLCLPVEQQGSLVPQKLKRLMAFVKCEKEARLSACLKHDLRRSVSQVNLGLLPTSGGTTDHLERLLALLVMAESANELELI